jgi:hypothetical protein
MSEDRIQPKPIPDFPPEPRGGDEPAEARPQRARRLDRSSEVPGEGNADVLPSTAGEPVVQDGSVPSTPVSTPTIVKPSRPMPPPVHLPMPAPVPKKVVVKNAVKSIYFPDAEVADKIEDIAKRFPRSSVSSIIQQLVQVLIACDEARNKAAGEIVQERRIEIQGVVYL